MTADHFDSIMNELLERRPFRIFTIELDGGRRFEVDYPHAMMSREGVAAFLAPGGVPILFDHDGVNQVIAAPASAES